MARSSTQSRRGAEHRDAGHRVARPHEEATQAGPRVVALEGFGEVPEHTVTRAEWVVDRDGKYPRIVLPHYWQREDVAYVV